MQNQQNENLTERS